MGFGTTSAYAENTLPWWSGRVWTWNYLRVRGEYPQLIEIYATLNELPPRTRRIPAGTSTAGPETGTTSAYAENTDGKIKHDGSPRNYLRVRGEYGISFPTFPIGMELPPRTRRIRVRKHNGQPVSGTTSAYAENTRSVTRSCWNAWNYLRVRGEYTRAMFCCSML